MAQRIIINTRQLLEAGKRWFAKPPATHQPPGDSMVGWTAYATQYKSYSMQDNWIGAWLRAMGVPLPSFEGDDHVLPGLMYMSTLFNAERRQFITWFGFLNPEQQLRALGRCRDRHPLDCGRPRCYACNYIKINQVPSMAQLRADLGFAEGLEDVGADSPK